MKRRASKDGRKHATKGGKGGKVQMDGSGHHPMGYLMSEEYSRPISEHNTGPEHNTIPKCDNLHEAGTNSASLRVPLASFFCSSPSSPSQTKAHKPTAHVNDGSKRESRKPISLTKQQFFETPLLLSAMPFFSQTTLSGNSLTLLQKVLLLRVFGSLAATQ
jgi:hypothetical protein